VRGRRFLVIRPKPALAALRPLLLSFLVVASLSGAAAANSKYAAIVVDVKTGKTLFSRNADAARYPASLTKMMTLYILFEEIERGNLSLKSRLKVSKYAAGRPPSKLGLKAGSSIIVRDAIRALAVKSANDVASVIAESIEGSESAFAQRMTRTARSLGMKRTTFRNASGLPDPRQKTTARDMARLGQALQDRFPAYYKYFSTRTFKYGKRTYRNTNRLLGVVKGMDGIKTGYTRASGFNLVTSVRQNDRHIIAVVMGGKTSKSRNAHMASLIKKNIRRAKRGKRRAPLLVAAAPLRPAPLPRSRPLVPAEVQQPAVVASFMPERKPSSGDQLADLIAAQTEASEPLSQLAAAPVTVPRPEENNIQQPTSSASIKNRASAPTPDARPQADAPQARPRKGSWFVQIAAVPTREGANRLLEQARLKAGPVLAKAEPLTQPVEKSGTTFYRARFAGFSGKKEARAVCARLKRKSVDCLAVPN
jgi:D-alanyl-D-alanine carboxypeptidase